VVLPLPFMPTTARREPTLNFRLTCRNAPHVLERVWVAERDVAELHVVLAVGALLGGQVVCFCKLVSTVRALFFSSVGGWFPTETAPSEPAALFFLLSGHEGVLATVGASLEIR
jgi:hypothetical protein